MNEQQRADELKRQLDQLLQERERLDAALKEEKKREAELDEKKKRLHARLEERKRPGWYFPSFDTLQKLLSLHSLFSAGSGSTRFPCTAPGQLNHKKEMPL